MEIDDGWVSEGGVSVNEQSPAQAYSGIYSRKFTATATGGGIRSNTFSTGSSTHVSSFWIYSVANQNVNIRIRSGTGTGDDVNEDFVVIAGEWTLVKKTYSATAGEHAYVSIRGAAAGTYYVDEPRIHKHIPEIFLDGDDYIRIHGIDFLNYGRGFEMRNGSDHNEISHCRFTNGMTETWYSSNIIWDNGKVASTNNWIHGCTFAYNGHVSGLGSCDDKGVPLRIGNSYHDDSVHNLVEDCLFYGGGHDLGIIATKYNTYRNNIYHHEAWIIDHWGHCSNEYASSAFGNRCLLMENPEGTGGGYCLIEGNRFGHAGPPADDNGAFGFANPADRSIVRYNMFYANGAAGYYFKRQNGYPDDNRLYHNTFFANGGGEVSNIFWKGICFPGGMNPPGNEHGYRNVIKNNILYDNITENYGCTGGLCIDDRGRLLYEDNTYTNNLETDPFFVNPDTGDPTSLTLPNLSLRPGSPAIDNGAALTTVASTDTGSGTTLEVDDAYYFQDGTWAPPGRIEADWIAVGTVKNTVQISAINYSTNTIYLVEPISRSDGQDVWLFKNSSGAIVLHGSAPDQGAVEFIPISVLPPVNVRIIDG